MWFTPGRLFLPLAAFLFTIPAVPQRRVDPRNMYERLVAIVPMTGAGTFNDPRRPMYAPIPGTESSKRLIGFSFMVSDDGKSALVEFVARDRSAFADILTNRQQSVANIWQKHEATKDDVEKEFRKLRKDFDINSFGVRVH
ncbi:MAG: hypothetical protein NTY38_17405 [Acidobacteria bacterium]|nr:hypothetical protein [Acidobacteriota bacterium]